MGTRFLPQTPPLEYRNGDCSSWSTITLKSCHVISRAVPEGPSSPSCLRKSQLPIPSCCSIAFSDPGLHPLDSCVHPLRQPSVSTGKVWVCRLAPFSPSFLLIESRAQRALSSKLVSHFHAHSLKIMRAFYILQLSSLWSTKATSSVTCQTQLSQAVLVALLEVSFCTLCSVVLVCS